MLSLEKSPICTKNSFLAYLKRFGSSIIPPVGGESIPPKKSAVSIEAKVGLGFLDVTIEEPYYS
jgi:hypothetical protein